MAKVWAIILKSIIHSLMIHSFMIYQDRFYRHLKLWMCFFQIKYLHMYFLILHKILDRIGSFSPQWLQINSWRVVGEEQWRTTHYSYHVQSWILMYWQIDVSYVLQQIILSFVYPDISIPKTKPKLGFWMPQELSRTFSRSCAINPPWTMGTFGPGTRGCSLLGTHRSPLKFVPWITSGFKVRGSFWSIFWMPGLFLGCQKCLKNIMKTLSFWVTKNPNQSSTAIFFTWIAVMKTLSLVSGWTSHRFTVPSFLQRFRGSFLQGSKLPANSSFCYLKPLQMKLTSCFSWCQRFGKNFIVESALNLNSRFMPILEFSRDIPSGYVKIAIENGHL